ncbi:glucan endo-1,3-beta-glucosidase 7-like isoform X2 [Euphorbia lathyris]|uniref:glucan endo-1,3-beta-glucosidase 7-like isoform X2 n=1 Tax=Euphorbia lathyris TaxID=212925 RepID=UPI0033144C10
MFSNRMSCKETLSISTNSNPRLKAKTKLVKMEGKVEEKAETMTRMSPPEGNTTFLGGTTWCIARAGVSHIDLQNALDWACGLGMANCTAIQNGGVCYQPNTLLSHASYAFNNYYQQNGNSDIACNFGGTATLTKYNPSYGNCVYPYAATPSGTGIGSERSSSVKYRPNFFLWIKFAGILLLLYSRS